MADHTYGKSSERSKSSEHGKGAGSHSSIHTSSTRTEKIDALSLLKQDHQTVKQLFEQIEDGSEEERTREIFNQIKRALEIHSAIEEEIFYPAVRKAKSEQVQNDISEAHDAHRRIDMLLGEIAQFFMSDEEAQADRAEADAENLLDGDTLETRLKALQEEVLRHVSDEEGEIFRDARKYLGDQLGSLGVKLQQRKERLEAVEHKSDGHGARGKNGSHSEKSTGASKSPSSHSGKRA